MNLAHLIYSIFFSFRFISGLDQNFPDERVKKAFIKQLYQLLIKDGFPFKHKKICLVGPSNSGKSSWFSVIQGIIAHTDVATLTREGKFCMHLINDDTQVVLMEEWDKGDIELSEFKKLVEGEAITVTRKNKSAGRVNIYRI